MHACMPPRGPGLAWRAHRIQTHHSSISEAKVLLNHHSAYTNVPGQRAGGCKRSLIDGLGACRACVHAFQLWDGTKAHYGHADLTWEHLYGPNGWCNADNYTVLATS